MITPLPIEESSTYWYPFALATLLIAALLFVGMSQTVSAQAKVAHINVTELMTAMPEMKAANTQLEKLNQTYDTEYNTMVEEFRTKIKKIR